MEQKDRSIEEFAEGASWTITRTNGRVKHARTIPERLVEPALLAQLKSLVRA